MTQYRPRWASMASSPRTLWECLEGVQRVSGGGRRGGRPGGGRTGQVRHHHREPLGEGRQVRFLYATARSTACPQFCACEMGFVARTLCGKPLFPREEAACVAPSPAVYCELAWSAVCPAMALFLCAGPTAAISKCLSETARHARAWAHARAWGHDEMAYSVVMGSKADHGVAIAHFANLAFHLHKREAEVE